MTRLQLIHAITCALISQVSSVKLNSIQVLEVLTAIRMISDRDIEFINDNMPTFRLICQENLEVEKLDLWESITED